MTTTERGIEDARKELGDLVNRAAIAGDVTVITRNRKRLAALVPLDLLPPGVIEDEEGGDEAT